MNPSDRVQYRTEYKRDFSYTSAIIDKTLLALGVAIVSAVASGYLSGSEIVFTCGAIVWLLGLVGFTVLGSFPAAKLAIIVEASDKPPSVRRLKRSGGRAAVATVIVALAGAVVGVLIAGVLSESKSLFTLNGLIALVALLLLLALISVTAGYLGARVKAEERRFSFLNDTASVETESSPDGDEAGQDVRAECVSGVGDKHADTASAGGSRESRKILFVSLAIMAAFSLLGGLVGWVAGRRA